MKTQDLLRLGVPQGAALKSGMEFIANFIRQGGEPARLEEELGTIIGKPESFLGDPLREVFARDLYAPAYKQRDALAPWHQWGVGLEAGAVQQMANACALPVAVAGALMPDAHLVCLRVGQNTVSWDLASNGLAIAMDMQTRRLCR